MTTDVLRLLAGKTIGGKYFLQRYIAGGASGGVFEATEVVRDSEVNTVALKIILPSPQPDKGKQLAEIQKTLQFDHKNIIRGFCAGEDIIDGVGPVLFLVTELAQQSLKARMDAGTMPVSETTKILCDVAAGLEYLHGHPAKCVHCDIKPENILRVGDTWKLADFGISRFIPKSTIVGSSGVGTIYYAPPESYQSMISTAWDIWSFGILAHEMLTGKFPFTATSPNEYIKKVIEETPRITFVGNTVLRNLMDMCLAKQKNQRPCAKEICSYLRNPNHIPARFKMRQEDRRLKLYNNIGTAILAIVIIATIIGTVIGVRALYSKVHTAIVNHRVEDTIKTAPPVLAAAPVKSQAKTTHLKTHISRLNNPPTEPKYQPTRKRSDSAAVISTQKPVKHTPPNTAYHSSRKQQVTRVTPPASDYTGESLTEYAQKPRPAYPLSSAGSISAGNVVNNRVNDTGAYVVNVNFFVPKQKCRLKIFVDSVKVKDITKACDEDPAGIIKHIGEVPTGIHRIEFVAKNCSAFGDCETTKKVETPTIKKDEAVIFEYYF